MLAPGQRCTTPNLHRQLAQPHLPVAFDILVLGGIAYMELGLHMQPPHTTAPFAQQACCQNVPLEKPRLASGEQRTTPLLHVQVAPIIPVAPTAVACFVQGKHRLGLGMKRALSKCNRHALKLVLT